MHDGSQKTLEEVVDWYAKGGHPNPHLDEKIKKLDLTDQDKKDLVEFIKAMQRQLPQDRARPTARVIEPAGSAGIERDRGRPRC